ncbi:hypothetical protein ANCCEY_00251 [Ancylostoma ceylanicum]|uniref:Uncharacterized protein n=1 Tax=Ancylostoma ceylanicum TaxID=53326 RepID=A0A0D6MAJ9_9BILA|nr:hypothetical protein ANCCEY_00251 [Ancylostoma ceylanicum]
MQHNEGCEYNQHCHILLYQQQNCVFGGQPKDQQRILSHKNKKSNMWSKVRYLLEWRRRLDVDGCSGRVEKDICFGCQQNMGCFLESLYSLMVTVQLSIDRGHDMVLTHFAPQTWYCNFKENLSNYNIIRYEEDERTVHVTADSEDRIKAEQTLLSNRTLLTILTQIYYYDFIVFDFKLPVIL